MQELQTPKSEVRKTKRIEKISGLIFLNPISKLFLPSRMKTDHNSKLRNAYFGYRELALKQLIGDKFYKFLEKLL